MTRIHQVKNQRKSPAKAWQQENYETLGVRPEGLLCGGAKVLLSAPVGAAISSHTHVLERGPCRSLGTQFSYLLASGVATMPRGFQTLVLGCSPGLAIRVVWSSEGLASSLPWGYRLCVLTLSQAGTPGSAHPTLGSGPHAAGVHTGSCPISQPDSPVSFDKAEMKRSNWGRNLQ